MDLPSTGTQRKIWIPEDHEGKAYIKKIQDVTPELKMVEAARQNFNGFKSQTANYAGTIPLGALEQWCRTYGYEYNGMGTDSETLRAFLNHRDNSKFKAIPGKL